jgi:hypothetical protein
MSANNLGDRKRGRPKEALSNVAKKVINANRLTRMNLLNANVTQHPKITIPIDAMVEEVSKEKDFSVDDVILLILNDHVKKNGKFKNLDDALELLKGIGDIDFSKFLANKDEANEFFGRVISRVESGNSSLSTASTLQMSIILSEPQIFNSVISGKSYENREQTSYFDNLFRFTLNNDCYIIYEKREDNSFYIDMIRCAPRLEFKESRSVKGSGRVMIYDWLLFLRQPINVAFTENAFTKKKVNITIVLLFV